MTMKLGMEARLYYDAAGMSADPTWTELTNVRDLTLNLEKGEADLTTRANNGWRATEGTLKDASVEFEMVWDTEDAGFTAIKDAYFNGTPIALAIMDGAVDADGSQGLWADFSIISFSRSEPLEEGISVSVTAKPAYNPTYPPEWKEITVP